MSRNMRSLSESNNEPSVSEQPDNLVSIVIFNTLVSHKISNYNINLSSLSIE